MDRLSIEYGPAMHYSTSADYLFSQILGGWYWPMMRGMPKRTTVETVNGGIHCFTQPGRVFSNRI
jgi:hypothetical protein